MLCRCVLASLFTRTERIYLSMYIFFMSLGCDKNLVDSEEMLGALVSRGFEVTDDESQAEVVLSMMQRKRVFRRFLIWRTIKPRVI